MKCNYIKLKLIKAINERYYRYFQEVGFEVLKDNEKLYENVLANLYNIQMAIDANYIDSVEGTKLKILLMDLRDLIDNKTVFSSSIAKVLQDIQNTSSHNVTLKVNLYSPSSPASQVMKILKDASKESYIVGGFVRDSIRGKTPKDMDFVTDTDVDILENLFTDAGFKVQSEGKQFLVLIVSKDSEQFEIAGFRKDKDNTGGEIGNIFEDAQRRDFSFNSLYYNIHTEIVQDPNGTGIQDLLAGTIKFIGNAKERLDEDPIRSMRFYRFISKGFKPDPKSLRAVRTRIQYDSRRITELQSVLTLPGVKEVVDTTANSYKMVKKVVNTSVEELQKTIISLERMRLEIERIVGIK